MFSRLIVDKDHACMMKEYIGIALMPGRREREVAASQTCGFSKGLTPRGVSDARRQATVDIVASFLPDAAIDGQGR
jgi:hypothetical protein